MSSRKSGSPREGGPAGISIGRALAIPPGIVHDELREFVAILDRIHGVGDLPRIPLFLGRLPATDTKGLVRRGRFTLDRDGHPESITIDAQ
jgi:hypothetical protein